MRGAHPVRRGHPALPRAHGLHGGRVHHGTAAVDRDADAGSWPGRHGPAPAPRRDPPVQRHARIPPPRPGTGSGRPARCGPRGPPRRAGG
ncbi:hypothetical protein ACFFX0_00725 [Citricoccus parietis]|uniref:Uncharacterized protein n=1 Tax=Citricoccus parietis TaxID=592307 RepID=A0ABV5FTK7_9MICC